MRGGPKIADGCIPRSRYTFKRGKVKLIDNAEGEIENNG
jgi:hypothetical protein